MILIDQKINSKMNHTLPSNIPMDKYLFFDIETTGFHAESTYLYLIGCIYSKDDHLYLKQWFSEDISEEKKVLSSFLEFVSAEHLLIHFNGSTFDLPYLSKKCKQHGIPNTLERIEQIDLYKIVTQYKKIFNLTSCRQKAIEEFLGIHRKDIYDGGELIQVYANYIGQKKIETLRNAQNNSSECIHSASEQLLDTLLLHNADDLKGLVQITDIFYYIDLFSSSYPNIRANLTEDILTLTYQLNRNYPTPLTLRQATFSFTLSGQEANVLIPLYKGELKHFYDDIANYYYLPLEDTAMHKSVAEFVDKAYRKKATKANCYVKKTGHFIPCYINTSIPFFKRDYKDKINYIEITDELLMDSSFLSNYTLSLLQNIQNI